MKLTKEQAEKRDRNREQGYAKWKADEHYQAAQRLRLSKRASIAKEPTKPARLRQRRMI